MIASRQHGMKKTPGERVTVRNDDFSRLSYYLRCATNSVGIDILPDEFIDYERARLLSQEKKDIILQLAYSVVNDKAVVDSVFFQSDKLCGVGHHNEFYDVTQVDTVLAINSTILIGGQQKQVKKIMAYRKIWMENNYYKPIKNQMRRIRQICDVREKADTSDLLAGFLAKLLIDSRAEDGSERTSETNHCSHCKGGDGKCACTHGCPPKTQTKCSITHHCSHCRGIEGGACACKYGCPPGLYSKCTIVHEGVTCDGCCGEFPITGGSRFKCRICPDFDLCQKCYDRGASKHDMTHGFDRIARIGSKPVRLLERQSPIQEAPKTPPRPAADAKVVTPDREIDGVTFAEAVPVGCPFQVGDSVTLGGLKSIGMNGKKAVVESCSPMPGDRIQVRLNDTGALAAIKVENLCKEPGNFQQGQMVRLRGLETKDMNGMVGMIDRCIEDRVVVKLYEGNTVSVKKSNVEVFADILD